MATKIRLARGGSKKRPFYRIVVADVRAPRDGRFIERLGTYDPRLPHENPERLTVKAERVQHWLGTGAQPTERVQKLLASLELMAPPARRDQPKKTEPKEKAKERAREKAEKAEAAAAAAAEAAAEAPAES